MHVGVLAGGDVSSAQTWSGVPFFICQALAEKCRKVSNLNETSSAWTRSDSRMIRWSRRLFKKGYLPRQNPRLLDRISQKIEKRIASESPDVILAITSDELVARLNSNIPIVHHSDATFDSILSFYPEYSNLWNFCIRRGQRYTQQALSKAAACTFPSNWAAESAKKTYGVTSEKITVIPYGANVPTAPKPKSMSGFFDRTCQLLFIGGDWERKGGPLVYETLLELERRDFDCQLVVVGADPKINHPKLSRVPYLDKQEPADFARYQRLWADAAFLFMPSRKETFGAIYSEAAANSVPAIAMDIGGVSSGIVDGKTGFLLPANADKVQCADLIQKLWTDQARYKMISEQARQRFETVLNWDVWSDQVLEILQRFSLQREKQTSP